MEILRLGIHYGMQFLVPGLIAYLFFNKNWKTVWLILIATMIIDLDHLLASPIFESNRCSINFHPLHTYWALIVYVVLLIPQRTRVIAIGLLLHLLTDYIDCWWL